MTIPLTFENRVAHMKILKQIIDAEEKVDRLNTEEIAEDNVAFVFDEIL